MALSRRIGRILTITPRLRLGIRLWCAGMLGIIAMAVLMLPRLLTIVPELTGVSLPPIPTWVLSVSSVVQNGVILAAAVWCGCALHAEVGLRAPLFEGSRAPLVPGLVGGALGGPLLIAVTALAPPALSAAMARMDAPLVVRVLYGGITEEILMRWGVMTLLVWLPWRFLGARRPAWFWLAIVVSAVAFGVGHLPMALLLLQEITPQLLLWIVGANTLFGILFGFLYWRYGLESAIVAHALTHVIAFVASR